MWPSHPIHMIRLGLCCIFRDEPIKFRTTAAGAVKKLRRQERPAKLSDICLSNARALLEALQYCSGHGIGCFRINSQILPIKTHPGSVKCWLLSSRAQAASGPHNTLVNGALVPNQGQASFSRTFTTPPRVHLIRLLLSCSERHHGDADAEERDRGRLWNRRLSQRRICAVSAIDMRFDGIQLACKEITTDRKSPLC